MIKKIDLPCNNAIGFHATWIISGEDYENVIFTNMEEYLKNNEKINILYYIDKDFKKYDIKAMFDDAKFGFSFWNKFDHIAIVTDVSWVKEGIHLFKFTFPGEVKLFDEKDLDDAKKWICSWKD